MDDSLFNYRLLKDRLLCDPSVRARLRGPIVGGLNPGTPCRSQLVSLLSISAASLMFSVEGLLDLWECQKAPWLAGSGTAFVWDKIDM